MSRVRRVAEILRCMVIFKGLGEGESGGFVFVYAKDADLVVRIGRSSGAVVGRGCRWVQGWILLLGVEDGDCLHDCGLELGLLKCVWERPWRLDVDVVFW